MILKFTIKDNNDSGLLELNPFYQTLKKGYKKVIDCKLCSLSIKEQLDYSIYQKIVDEYSEILKYLLSIKRFRFNLKEDIEIV